MSAARNCPQCGNPLSSDAPQGLCPECLLRAALPGNSGLESSATGLYSSSPAIPIEAGARLKYFGDYELLEEIARGGMGVVWKARQTSLNRVVALKMIRAGALASPEEVQRFLREAEAAANLQHPNIVAIHEVGEHDGQHYFSMDYVAGRDLGAVVKDGPLSPQLAARYVKTIAEAIQYAHQRGTLHRDLKPQNVLIDATDQPRITDFGLAKITADDSRLTQTGVVMGSPSYMPPEQAAGRHGDIGPASDVYSLGAMLYELLTGRPPFRGTTPMATLREVMEAEPIAPRRLKADIPPDLETICLKCLEKSPLTRYPTARALAEELDRFLKGEPIQARPASAIRKTVSWARRHPGALAGLAALVMVTLAIGIFYLIEENAFLRAQQADPSLARKLGPRHRALQVWGTISYFAMGAGFFLYGKLWWRARDLSLEESRDPAKLSRPLKPLGERTRTFALGAALVLIGVGVMVLVLAIQANVREGEKFLTVAQFTQIYFPIYLGIWTLALVIRDFRLVHYGIKCRRQVTAEQIRPIMRALEEYDLPAAIKHYREADPEASEAEARAYVHLLAGSLRQQRPLSLAALNWKAMLKCVAAEALVLGAWWLMLEQSSSPSDLSRFAYSFLFGMGLPASGAVKGIWRWMPWFAALLMMAVCETIWFYSTEAPSVWAAWFFICVGFLCGNFLMVSGITPRRRGGQFVSIDRAKA